MSQTCVLHLIGKLSITEAVEGKSWTIVVLMVITGAALLTLVMAAVVMKLLLLAPVSATAVYWAGVASKKLGGLQIEAEASNTNFCC